MGSRGCPRSTAKPPPRGISGLPDRLFHIDIAEVRGGVARRHGQNRGGGEGCGYAASLGQRKRVAHIPTAETEAARSGLILEAQGQARSHLKFNPSWSYEWGPVQTASASLGCITVI